MKYNIKTIRKKKTKKKNRKTKKRSRRTKKKNIKKQKGGGVLDYYNYTLEDIEEEEPGRFEYDTFEYYNVEYNNDEDMFQIIDKEYNNRYLFEEGRQRFSVLMDDDNKKYYAFDEDGEQITKGSEDAEYIEDIFEEASREKDLTDALRVIGSAEIKVEELNSMKGCYTPFNLDMVKAKVEDLNKILKKKCPNLELQFDNYYNLKGNISIYFDEPFDGLIICLYYKKNCISSVILEIVGNDIVTINSRTDENFQGNKFNKLLRCIAIIISSILTCNDTDVSFTTLRSRTFNPISPWLLISNFKTIIRKIDLSIDDNYEREFMKLKAEYPELTDNEIKKKLVFENKYNIYCTDVPLDAENVEKAERIFNELDIICPP